MKYDLLRSQSEAIPWLLERPRALYAAGMGLGKTRTALEVFQMRKLYGEVDHLLILAPKRVAHLTWPEEVRTWAPDLSVRVLPKDGWEWGQDVSVLNYEQIGKLVQLVKSTRKYPRTMMVLDECTCARNPRAKRMQLLRPLIKRSKMVYGMTGTPTPNGYIDLYGQFKAIIGADSPLGYNKERYEDKFFIRPRRKFAKLIFREDMTDELFRTIEPVMLAQKSSDYLDLPDIEYVDIEVTLPKEVMSKYREFKKKLFIELEDGEVTAFSAGVLVKKLLQFTSGKVFDEDKEVLHVHDEKTKAVSKIKARPLLVLRDFTHTEIPGAVEFEDDLIEPWNAGKVPIMSGHPKSMGIGLNLQHGGSDLLWHTPTFSLLDTQQAEARLWRTGQKHPVTVYRLIAKGTVDEAVLEALRIKDTDQDVLMTTLSFLR